MFSWTRVDDATTGKMASLSVDVERPFAAGLYAVLQDRQVVHVLGDRLVLNAIDKTHIHTHTPSRAHTHTHMHTHCGRV